jgi:hypothetical protein
MGAISTTARSTALMALIGAISLCVLGNGAFAFPYTYSYNYMQPKEGTVPDVFKWLGIIN